MKRTYAPRPDAHNRNVVVVGSAENSRVTCRIELRIFKGIDRMKKKTKN